MSDNQTEMTTGDRVDSEGSPVDAETVATRDTEAFVSEDPLVELLTPGAKVRILLALVRLRGEKLNPSEICERAAVNIDTWYRHRDDLIERYGVIEEAGHAGNSPMYRVEMDNQIIKRLDEVRDLAAGQRNRRTDPEQ